MQENNFSLTDSSSEKKGVVNSRNVDVLAALLAAFCKVIFAQVADRHHSEELVRADVPHSTTESETWRAFCLREDGAGLCLCWFGINEKLYFSI